MKWERTIHRTCVDSALHALEQLLHGGNLLKYPTDLRNDMKRTFRDLKFFKMFIWGLTFQKQSSQDWVTMMLDFQKTSEHCSSQIECATYAESMEKWVPMSHLLRGKIEQYKPLIQQICTLVLGGGLFIKNFKLEELFVEYGAGSVSFIELILDNLGILSSSFDLIDPIKQELTFLGGNSKVSGDFAIHFSCLVCLHWLREMNEGSADSMASSSLFVVMQKYRPYTLGILTLYVGALSKAKGHDKVQMEFIRGLTVSYADFLLGHFFIVSKDDIDSLRKGLLFLFSFVMDPWKQQSDENKFLLAEIYAIINEAPSIFCSPETELSGYLGKVNRAKGHVQKLYAVKVLSLDFHFSSTDVIGFLNSFLANLEKMLKGKVDLIPFVRDAIIILQEELAALVPFLRVHFELLDTEHEYLWTQIVNLAYFAAYIIKLCPAKCFCEWYGLLFLPSFVKDIKMLKSEVIKKINQGQIQMYGHKRLTPEGGKSSFVPEATTSKNEGAFIGYDKDAEEIINHLVRGTKDLMIVSISGMAGQGKTTLAKRIYNDPTIVYHFHKREWCYVSKECKVGELFAKIVSGGGMCGDSIHNVCDCLRKSLKGSRYLIVLDDIWDVELWQVMQGAFPNDKNGSRILFTTRNDDLASQAQKNSKSHPLRPLSYAESWELMNVKLSDCDGFPPASFLIAEEIVNLCKGLPLAIALIAPVLRRAGPKMDVWKQVARNLNSYLAGEGCMDIVELSYTYLPRHLKPCFLYFGAFPRNVDVRARKLKLLWCAEGFVKGNEMQTAEEYLDDLVSHNLVIVSRRSPTGSIKECRIHHDMLYDLCLEKAAQDNFLHVAPESIVSSIQKRYDFHLRLSIHRHGHYSLPTGSNARRELPSSQIHTVLFNSFNTFGNESWYYFLSKFRVLTVLDLEVLCLSMFPEVILYNIHLRYLALWGEFEHIPASIIDLWNLETFILRSECDAVCTPDALWDMESLIYVDINTFSLNQKALLQNKSFMCIENVEVLKGITLKYGLTSEEFLGRFVRLRKLKCWCDREDNEGDFHTVWFSMFRLLEKLESLTLCRPFTFRFSHVYQQLPTTLTFPKNLKKLTLSGGFGLPWSAMSTIGKLSNLQVLVLHNESCSGTTWHLRDDDFLKLTCLKLHLMKVERIDDSGCEDTPFPCLEKLLLLRCWNLKEIPSSFGDINTLDTIDVSWSTNVSDSVKQIVEQQHDMGNDHLQVIGLIE